MDRATKTLTIDAADRPERVSEESSKSAPSAASSVSRIFTPSLAVGLELEGRVLDVELARETAAQMI